MHLRGHGTAVFTKLPPTLDPSHLQWECRSLMPTQIPRCAHLQLTAFGSNCLLVLIELQPETERPQSTVHERPCQQERTRNIQTSNDHMGLTA